MPPVSRIQLLIVSLLCLALAIAGCGDAKSAGGEDLSRKPEVTVPSGPPPKEIQRKDLVEGDGAVAKDGDRISIEYVGVGYDSGEEFEESWSRAPYSFTLGHGEVLPGWDRGIVGMKVGGRRELTIPPDFAYGKGGFPPTVGSDETVIYVIDLISVH
jgi:peptidylprolyl isomerase